MIKLGNVRILGVHFWDAYNQDRAEMLCDTIKALIRDYDAHDGALEEFTVEVSPEQGFSDFDGVRVALYGFKGAGPTNSVSG